MTKCAHLVVTFLILATVAVYGQSNLSTPATFSNSNVSLGSVLLGTTVSKNLTISNTGTVQLPIFSFLPSLTVPFTIPANPCNLFVDPAVQALCQTVYLIGTGSSPTTLTPSSLSFDSVNVGSGTSIAQNATLKNNGIRTVSITNIAVTSGPFVQTNNCPSSLAGGAKCSISLKFTPKTGGSVQGTLTVTDNLGDTLTTSLSGTGVAVLQSITVTPANATLTLGAQQQYNATGNYNDGTQKPITSPVWASSSATTISSAGLATAVAVGTTTISATSSGITGKTTLTVTAPVTLQSVTVTPANQTLQAPGNVQYAATANYSDGTHADVTTLSTWSSANTGTATINAAGYATTGVAGSTTVSATYNSVAGSTLLTVTHTQTGIVVSPASKTLNTGDSQQFYAYPTYSDNTSGTTAVTATWTSTDKTIAQVDGNGLAVADAAGTATISAASGAYASNATVTVNGANACTSNNRIDMKLLVATYKKSEADFPAITTTLNYLHMPYDVFDFSTGTVTPGQLYSGCHAFYKGVIMAYLDGTGYDATANTYTYYDWSTNPPTPVPFSGYDVLQNFEKTFGIRQLNWYAVPAPSIGFNWSTSSTTGLPPGDTALFNTSSAQSVFPYVNPATPLAIDPTAYVYLATAISGTPLVSDGNYALVLDYPFPSPDNREYLSNTFDSNATQMQNLVLSYGLVSWVTNGMFVGEKHIYFTPQEDDWGIDDDIWTLNTGNYLPVTDAYNNVVAPPAVESYPSCPAPPTPFSSVTGMAYRISDTDAQAFVNWQNTLQSNPMFNKFKLYNAFNGCGLGTTDCQYPGDKLTAWTQNPANSAHFGWINHTYSHADLNVDDLGNPQTYATDYYQIHQNIIQEQSLGFADFSFSYMVTPDISGLNYPYALQAMVDSGVQYVVSDTSCSAEKFVGQIPTCDVSSNNGPGPGFNKPIINTNNPITGQLATGNIFEIPRRPSNLFYNVGDPDGWDHEYQCIYQTQPPYATYTVQNIKDFIANNFVSWMLQGDADPEMFHQTNLMAYDGTHSLLSDLLDDTFTMYQSYFNLPVQSVDMDKLGQFMLNNLAIDQSGVIGTVNNGSSRTVTLTVTNPATIPVTGLSSTDPATGTLPETYGGQSISHVTMTAGETLTLKPQ